MKLLNAIRAALAPDKPAEQVMSEHEAFFQYADARNRRALDAARAAFDVHFERAIKVLTLLTGGAGALAAYTLGKWRDAAAPELAALLVLVLMWSGCAVWLAIHGMRSRYVTLGAKPKSLVEIYAARVGDLKKAQPADKAAAAFRVVQLSEIMGDQSHLDEISEGVTTHTRDLRRIIVIAAFAPITATAAGVLAHFLG